MARAVNVRRFVEQRITGPRMPFSVWNSWPNVRAGLCHDAACDRQLSITYPVTFLLTHDLNNDTWDVQRPFFFATIMSEFRAEMSLQDINER